MTDTRFAATGLLILLGGIALAALISVTVFLSPDQKSDASPRLGHEKTLIHEGKAPAVSSKSQEAP